MIIGFVIQKIEVQWFTKSLTSLPIVVILLEIQSLPDSQGLIPVFIVTVAAYETNVVNQRSDNEIWLKSRRDDEVKLDSRGEEVGCEKIEIEDNAPGPQSHVRIGRRGSCNPRTTVARREAL
ncbi:hypothetical protein T4E_878 [Trichinella pseudospiralis]|uniref:Uncharacterized protein n=1 Tax=Trichinella pseudospiralis TaxID=6337 RepID=A0A0V0XD40_TRIPS|nr:hypothetical protein T4E_878 [Trichinella pseudospiralis]